MLGRQAVQRPMDELGLVRGNAGRRFVEQQHPRPQRQRDGDLEQPLLAVGELRDAPVGDVADLHLFELRLRLVAGSARHCRPKRSIRQANPSRSAIAIATLSRAVFSTSSVLI